MPLYEYKCSKCGNTFEVIQKFSDAPLEVHEACGGHVERVISAPALQFKGSGWYITDYSRAGKSDSGDSKPAGTKSEGSSENKSESKTESKSESKSETKTESKPASSTKSD